MTGLERLRKAVAAMTPGPYVAYERDPEGDDQAFVVTAPGEAVDIAVMMPDGSAAADATGIVELRNAAPLLLDLADANRRWRDAKCPPDCRGDNHVEECDGSTARSDMLHILNRIEKP